MAAEDAGALLDEIRRQAELERERIQTESRGRADRAREAADTEIRAMETEAERLLTRRLELDRARIFGELRLEERVRILKARRAAIARAFGLARDELASSDASRSRSTLQKLIREALQAVGGDAELEVSRSDAEAARAALTSLGVNTRVTTEASDAPGVVVAASRDGLRRARNGLSARLEASETLLEQDVARILFGGA